MTIAKKPSEMEIQGLIRRGSAPPKSAAGGESVLADPIELKLRIYRKDLFDQLEESRDALPVKKSRNIWALELLERGLKQYQADLRAAQ